MLYGTTNARVCGAGGEGESDYTPVAVRTKQHCCDQTRTRRKRRIIITLLCTSCDHFTRSNRIECAKKKKKIEWFEPAHCVSYYDPQIV